MLGRMKFKELPNTSYLSKWMIRVSETRNMEKEDNFRLKTFPTWRAIRVASMFRVEEMCFLKPGMGRKDEADELLWDESWMGCRVV